jgi:DNA replication protein DnaC
MIFDKLDEKSYAIRAVMVCACPVCSGSGVIIDNPADPTPKGKDCECVERWKRIHQLIRAGIPYEYRNVTSFDFSGIKNKTGIKSVQAYADNLERAREHGLSMFLTGDVDAGKTTAGCYIAIRAIQDGWPVFYTVLEKLAGCWLEAVTSGGEDRKRANTELSYIEQVDFLIIDEMGKESGKDGGHVRTQLDTLLRGRIANGLPFICISQLDIEGIQQKYGKPLASLFTERVRHLTFIREGFRPKTQLDWGALLEGKDGTQ